MAHKTESTFCITAQDRHTLWSKIFVFPPNSYVQILTPKEMMLGEWFNLSGGGLTNAISVYKRGPRVSSSPVHQVQML